jgi:putative addiction module CopG family antidote
MSTSDDMNIRLPAELGEYVLGRVATGEFADADDYIRSLVEADRELQIEMTPELERLLLEGLNSGPARTISAEEWQAKIDRLQDRHAGPKSS